jgi:3-oxoacyl-[acyl-carrier protein] reductase
LKNTVIITGASRGIGKACSLEFANAGYNVIINFNKSQAEAEKIFEKIRDSGGSAEIIKADVASFEGCRNLFKRSIEIFGKVEVLVNNAGTPLRKLFQDVTESEWKDLFNLNVGGVFNLSKFAVEHMVKNKKGKIINISSVWGLTGASLEVHYSASKAALIGFTKALAKELAPSGIQVNCVAPGVINTEMIADLTPNEISVLSSEIPLGRLGTPREIARMVLFLAGPESDYITGQVISPNGGIVV